MCSTFSTQHAPAWQTLVTMNGGVMPAYIIAIVTVTKPDAYDGYRALAGAAVAKHGGRFLRGAVSTRSWRARFPASGW